MQFVVVFIKRNMTSLWLHTRCCEGKLRQSQALSYLLANLKIRLYMVCEIRGEGRMSKSSIEHTKIFECSKNMCAAFANARQQLTFKVTRDSPKGTLIVSTL